MYQIPSTVIGRKVRMWYPAAKLMILAGSMWWSSSATRAAVSNGPKNPGVDGIATAKLIVVWRTSAPRNPGVRIPKARKPRKNEKAFQAHTANDHSIARAKTCAWRSAPRPSTNAESTSMTRSATRSGATRWNHVAASRRKRSGERTSSASASRLAETRMTPTVNRSRSVPEAASSTPTMKKAGTRNTMSTIASSRRSTTSEASAALRGTGVIRDSE